MTDLDTTTRDAILNLEQNGFFIGIFDPTEERYISLQGVTPDDLKTLAEQNRELTESNRYALATFRALDRYTFEDSDHGLLIAEAVIKLEAVLDNS